MHWQCHQCPGRSCGEAIRTFRQQTYRRLRECSHYNSQRLMAGRSRPRRELGVRSAHQSCTDHSSSTLRLISPWQVRTTFLRQARSALLVPCFLPQCPWDDRCRPSGQQRFSAATFRTGSGSIGPRAHCRRLISGRSKRVKHWLNWSPVHN